MPENKAEAGSMKFDTKIPLWAFLVTIASVGVFYFAQQREQSIEMTKVSSDISYVKKAVERMENSYYSSKDFGRDMEWRDQRMIDYGKRIADLEAKRR